MTPLSDLSAANNQGITAVLEELARYYPAANTETASRAYELVKQASTAHTAPLVLEDAVASAGALARMRLDPETVAAALVAPLVLEWGESMTDMRAALGTDVEEVLSGVERIATIRWDRVEEESAETLRRMFVAIAQDVRVVLVVLSWRVQRLRRRAQGPRDEEQQSKAREALDVFAPLANRLGIWQFKWELEDGALKILKPEVYRELATLLESRRDEREALVQAFVEELSQTLAGEGIHASIKGRPKHVYSIYKKMQRKEVSFDQIYDVSAVRVLTDSVQQCYAVLGAVHSAWTPVPSEFDDYIAMPKPNGYQSLHTVVMVRGRPIEVQIRTEAMHNFAELGVAAHWAYKEARRSKGVDTDRFTVLRQLIDWEKEVQDPAEMVALLRTDVFKDQVYVFTPQGKVIDLPLGATPLDFAYRIHTMVGHRCRGARVNDQIVPLNYHLKSGDRVEILTHKEPQPSRDWMNEDLGFLKTASARSKVRSWLREQSRETSVHAGRDLIHRELSRLRLHHVTAEQIAERLKYLSVDDLAAAIGYGDRNSASVVSAALGIERELAPPTEVRLPPTAPTHRPAASSGIIMDDVENIQGDRARCCNPVPGDDVVGFISRGRGLVIHRRDCAQVQASPEPERLVSLQWGARREESHTVIFEVRAQARPGLLAELIARVSSVGADVSSAKSERTRDDGALILLGVECTRAEQVAAVLERLGSHAEVQSAERHRG